MYAVLVAIHVTGAVGFVIAFPLSLVNRSGIIARATIGAGGIVALSGLGLMVLRPVGLSAACIQGFIFSSVGLYCVWLQRRLASERA